MIRVHDGALPLLFVLGLAAAFAGTLLGGHSHGFHQLLLAGPVAVGGALLLGAQGDREWWRALGVTGAGAVCGALILLLA